LGRNLVTIVKIGLSWRSPCFGYRFFNILDLYKSFSLLPSWAHITISIIALRNLLVIRIIYKDRGSLIFILPCIWYLEAG